MQNSTYYLVPSLTGTIKGRFVKHIKTYKIQFVEPVSSASWFKVEEGICSLFQKHSPEFTSSVVLGLLIERGYLEARQTPLWFTQDDSLFFCVGWVKKHD